MTIRKGQAWKGLGLWDGPLSVAKKGGLLSAVASTITEAL